jgi:phosphoribosylglycinamide formyltransferase-1
MKKLTGIKKVKVAVFISGTGSNLRNIIKFSKNKKSPISVNLIISNKKTAKGLKYANQNKIEKKIFNFKNISFSEKKILKILLKKKIELICLAGFMRILSKFFIQNFNGKIINIHPSLLPKYKGLNTHQRVLENKEKFSGCTVHYVSSKLDSGKIIFQKKIKIRKNDTISSLQRRILMEEHKIYPIAINKILD